MEENTAKQLTEGQGANRYRYQSFNVRVNQLKIKITRQVGIVEDSTVTNGSFFNDSLEEWKELNLSAPFVRFALDVRNCCQTLPQLLFHKAAVVDLLEKNLKEGTALNLEPVLDLVTQLSRDLEDELYPDLERLLTAILPLVEYRDVRVIEWSFNCIASLFKKYVPHLRTNLCPIFTMMAPFLGESNSHNPYIRNFAAESFSYLIRKSPHSHLKVILKHIFTLLSETPTEDFVEGVAKLLFETIKLVGNQFQHRGVDVVLRECIQALKQESTTEENLTENTTFRAISKTLVQMVHFSTKEHFQDVCTMLVDELDQSVKEVEATSKTSDWVKVAECMAFIRVVVSVRKANRIDDFVRLFEADLKVSNLTLSTKSTVPAIVSQEVMQLSTSLFAYAPLESVLYPGGLVLESIFKHKDVSAVLAFSISLINIKWAHYTQILLPHIVKYCSAHWNKDNYEQIIIFLATLFSSNVLEITPGMIAVTVDENGQVKFPAGKPSKKGGAKEERIVEGILELLTGDSKWQDEAAMMANVDLTSDTVESSRIALVTAALSIIPNVSSPFKPTTDAISTLIQSLLASLSKEDQSITLLKKPFVQGSIQATLHILLGESIEILSVICERAAKPGLETLRALWDTIISKVLCTYGSNEVVLRGVAKYVTVLKESLGHKDLFTTEVLRKVYPFVERNLNSLQHRRRLYTLQIVSSFEVIPFEDTADDKLPQQDIFWQCLAIEDVAVTVDTYREKTMQIRKLNTMVSSKRVNVFYNKVAMRLSLGILTINFQPLWADATALLVKVADLYPDAFWELLSEEIKRFEDEVLLIESSLSRKAIADYRDTLTRLVGATEAKKKGINFDCPNFKKVRLANTSAFEKMDKAKAGWGLAMHFITTYAPGEDRLDYWNYYGLIIKALTQVPSIAEVHNRQLVEIFLKFIKNEYEPAWNRRDDADDEDEEAEANTDEKLKVLPKTAKDTKARLHLFLTLFSKFKNPKQTFESATMLALYLRLLTMGDSALQTLALECIFTFKSPALMPYKDNLKNMLDEVKFRDELSTFIIAAGDSSSIGSIHRDEVMPVIIRLLYGCMITRKGTRSAKAGMSARRKAVLTALGGCTSAELGFFISLMLAPFNIQGAVVDDKFQFSRALGDSDMDVDNEGPIGPLNKQAGFLTNLDDLFKQLGTTVEPFIPQLLSTVMCMIDEAQKRLDIDTGLAQGSLGPEDGAIETTQTKQLKDIRQSGIKRITRLFNMPITRFDYLPYVPAMFTSFLNRRIPRMDLDNTQAPSAIMELFSVWAGRKEYVTFLVDYNPLLLEKLYSCLSAKKVRDPVISMVLEVCEDILGHCAEELDDDNKPLTEVILVPYINPLLDNLENVLSKSSEEAKFGKDTFSKREIAILSQIASYVKNGPQAIKLVDLLLPSLKKNHRLVPERTKADILRTIVNFLPIIPDLVPGSTLLNKYYNHLVVLFSTLVTKECRVLLVGVMKAFAAIDSSLQVASDLIADLNSFSAIRMDMPDFDLRMDAFNLLTNTLYKSLNDRQWLPVLHNMLFYVRDPEEMSIRSNSTFALTRFIDQCADLTEGDEQKEKFIGLLSHVIYPGLKKGVKSPIELVRFEFISVLAHAVKRCGDLVQFSDMQVLLANGDEEASFFTNIYHIQLHRRIRALNRFSEECQRGTFRPTTLTQIFAPLIAHFIFEADKSTDHNLVNETISTLGAIASQLPWGSYYALLKGYLKLIPRKADMEKILVRTVIAILDNFHFDIKNVEVSTIEDAMAIRQKKTRISKPRVGKKDKEDGEDNERPDEMGSKRRSGGDGDEQDVDMEEAPMPESSKTAETASDEIVDVGKEAEEEEHEGDDDDEEGEEMEEETIDALTPEESAAILAAKIHDTVIKKLLPELHRYLTNRDDASVVIRVPVALAITKLLKALPEISLKTNLPGLLTSVCQILKSRQQEARDSTRETLVKITLFLGAPYFSFILKEMRGVLLRGYQLHVLGFTVHSLITHLMPTLEVGDLDYCLKDIVDVLIQDIFGETGIEKETEEITNKMKEAKTNLSFHSFELLSGIIHFKNMGVIMVPIKELLSETEALKVMRKVDELLRRLSTGLNNNPKFETRETLIFCHGLISQNLALSKSKDETKKAQSRLEINYTVDTKRPTHMAVDCFPANAHRFVAFGLYIFRSALNRNKFDVRSTEQLQLLDPFVEIVGNGVFAKHPDVIGQSLKIMCVLAKLRLPSLDRGLPVVIKQTFVLVKTQGSTKSELAQSCFRMLAVAIRECKAIVVKEEQLTMLLKMIQPDLEEPERQGTTFNLIRAIVSRQFVVPEMYDLMTDISQIMVTSQSAQARDLCRHALLQFLLDYPQGRGRLRNHMNFLVKNLSYVFESGRQSVMEMLHVIIQKFADEILMDYAEMFFLALVMQLVNDESSKCREMAGALIKALFQKMNRTKLDNSYLLLGKWFDQSEQRSLQRAAAQVYGLAIDAFGELFKKQIPTLLPRLELALQSSLHIMEEAQEQAEAADKFEDNGDAMDLDADWEVGYYALNTFTKLVKHFPTVINSDKVATLWPLIRDHLLHPHAWVRLSATRLFGVFFSGIDPLTRQALNSSGAEGQTADWLTPAMLKSVAQKFCEQLKSELLSQELGGQIVKNLFFMAKCFYALPMDLEIVMEDEEHEEADGDEEDEEEEEEDEEDEEEIATTNGNGTNKRSIKERLPVNRTLFWLVKRLSFLSRGAATRNNKNVAQQRFIFQSLAAIASYIRAEDLKPYLIPIIAPIYRVVNDETAKGIELEELKKLGAEVLDLVQKRAGTTDYFEAYNKVRQQILEIRRERKQKRVMQAMNDPEGRARRRIQKNEMKSRRRQAKTKEFAKDKVRLTTIKKRRME